MEAVLRAADQAGVQVDEASLEALHEGARAISVRVRAVAEGRAPAEPAQALLATFDALELGEAAPAPIRGSLDLGEDAASKVDDASRALLLQGAAKGARALRVDFSPSPERAEAGVTITSVRIALASLGEIVKIVPLPVPLSKSAPSGLRFAIFLLSQADDAAVAAAAHGSVDGVRQLAEPALAAPDTEGAAPAEAVEDPVRRDLLRVDVARVDEAMEHLSALIVTRSRLARAVAELARAGTDVAPLAAILVEQSRQLRGPAGIPSFASAWCRSPRIFDRLPLVMRRPPAGDRKGRAARSRRRRRRARQVGRRADLPRLRAPHEKCRGSRRRRAGAA